MELTKLLYSNFEPDDKCAQGDCGRLHAAYHQRMHGNLFLKIPQSWNIHCYILDACTDE